VSGKELLLKALRNEQTPRPAWVPFVGVHGGKMIGVTASDYLTSADRLVEGLTKAKELYQPDGLPLVFDLQVEAELQGCQLRWADDSPPAVISHPLEEVSLGDLPSYDLSKGRFPAIADATQRLKKQIGDEVALYGLITGPFTLALHLAGTNIFLDMFSEPEKVKELLNYTAQIAQKTAGFYIEQGADVIAVVDPMTSQISPDHFQEFVSEYVDSVFNHVRSAGALSSLFVCGNATRNLEKMCATTCDNVSIDENIDFATLRDLCGKTGKSFGGNLKLTTVLLLGSELDAQKDAVRCIDIGGERGFVLAPGCDLPYATPTKNLEAVAKVVHDEYARSVAKAAAGGVADTFEDVNLPDYGTEQQVIVDVVTLDSASCAPCQYMVRAVEEAVKALGRRVVIREHKITTRNGLGTMSKLGVGQIPTICIDGEVQFPSIIPDTKTLSEAIETRANAKGC
jgi:uroporphyrinogen decarboxylase